MPISSPVTSTWPRLRCDGLQEGEYRENCLSATVLCTIIMVHNKRYEQFLQVGRLYRAFILLGLALYLPSASVISVYIYIPFGELSLVGLALDMVASFSAMTLLVGSCDP